MEAPNEFRCSVGSLELSLYLKEVAGVDDGQFGHTLIVNSSGLIEVVVEC